MGCNPSKDGMVGVFGKTVGAVVGDAVGAADKSPPPPPPPRSSSGAKDDAPDTLLIPLTDDSGERDTSTSSTSVEENSKTMKTSEEVDFEKEFRPDDVELCHAATKIQASFRGHMTRKQQAGGKDEPGGAAAPATASKTESLESQLKNVDINKDLDPELLDVDLADPELHKAATKIQASFRGHKARKADDAVDNKE